jgi:hypothetical protein
MSSSISRGGATDSSAPQFHRDDDVFREAMRRVFAEEGASYPVTCVVLVAVERMDELVSPGYMHVSSEHAMRDSWRQRRASLDTSFEEHAKNHPFVPDAHEAPASGAD